MKFDHYFIFDLADNPEPYWLVATNKKRSTTNEAMKAYREFDLNISSNIRLLKHILIKLPYFIFLPLALLLMTIAITKQNLVSKYLAIFSIVIEAFYLIYTMLNLIAFSFSDAVTLNKIILFFIALFFINYIFLMNFLIKFSYFKFDKSQYEVEFSFILCMLLNLSIFIFICVINFFISHSESIIHFTLADVLPFLILMISNGLIIFFVHYKYRLY